MRALVSVLLVVVALVNLVPVVGVLSVARLEALYGVAIEDPNLAVLMRHRAVLFGIVGGLLLASVRLHPLRPAAVVAGLTSMLSFVLVAWLVGEVNEPLRRVVAVDLGASALLVVAALLDRRTRKAPPA